MADGRDSYIRKGVYQRYVLGVSELRKLHHTVHEHRNGRRPLGMSYASPYCTVPSQRNGQWGGDIYISAWASALLVLTVWAMRRPLRAGRQRYRLPRFFVYMPNTFQSRPFRPGEFAGNNEKLIWKSLSKTGIIRSLANALRVGCKKLNVIKLTQSAQPWTALLLHTSPTLRGFL